MPKSSPKWSAIAPIPEPVPINLLRYDGHHIMLPAVAIIVGGDDEGLKGVDDELMAAVGSIHKKALEISRPEDLDAIPDDLLYRDGIMMAYVSVKLMRGAGIDHDLRHKTVRRMKAIGAQRVSLVWVQSNPNHSDPRVRIFDQVLMKNPPNLDGIDCILVREP